MIKKNLTEKELEIKKIIDSEHENPHSFLGMHREKNKIVIRTFLPYAKKVFIENLDANQKVEMSKINNAGIFEIVFDSCEIFDYKYEILDYKNKKYEIFDAYNFDSLFSELDLYLFGQGTHYEIFDKLGAHVTKIKNISGVNFAVWAPNAKRVSVIGDFNNWDGRINQMRELGNSGIWEIFIPRLKNFDLYKFEIKTQENFILKKADPYGNFCEVRPKTASIVFDVNKYKWHDEKYLFEREQKFNLKKLNQAMNIYEVHIGSWRRIMEGKNRFLTYKEFAEQIIDYVKEMHYTHIELMAICEHPLDESWGYQVTGYYAPTSRFGNPEDFMYLIDKCHENNIGVIIDWVPAHFPKDDHGLKKFDGSCLYEHADPRQGEHPDWGTLIFNYGRNEVKNFLIANALFWIEKFHIDGLRVDAVASMLYLNYSKEDGEWVANKFGGIENLEAIEFMKHMNSIISKKHKDVLMIAEESTSFGNVSRPVENDGLGFNFKWNMGWMNDFLRYMQKDCVYRKWHHNDLTFSMIYAFSENFILVLSHDEVVHGKKSLINKMPGDLWQKFANLRVAFGFMIGHPGKKLSFMGNEFAQFDEWCEAKSLDWHLLNFDTHKKFKDYMRDLNKFYLENEILYWDDFSNNGFEWIDCDNREQSVLVFMRKGQNLRDIIIFVYNFTPVALFEHRIGVPFEGIYKEIFNSDEMKYNGSGVLNKNLLKSEKIDYNWRENSIKLKVPPLGFCALKLNN